MTSTSRRRIAALSVLVSALIVLACWIALLAGHANARTALAAASGLVSVTAGIRYLRSTRR